MSMSMRICVTKTSSNALRSSLKSYRTNSVSLSSQGEGWRMRRAKPLFWYTGGKAKLFTTYYPFFQGLHPEHCLDYFGGSGTMSLWFHRLYPQAKVYLNEIDPALYKLFKCMQEEYEEFCEALQWLEQEKLDLLAEARSSQDRFEHMKEWYYSLRDEYYNQTQEPPQEWIQADFEAHPEDYEPIE